VKQGTADSILGSLRTVTKPSVILIVILALTFYLRLLYFGQYIDGDVGNAAYQAWRMAEGEILIDLEGPGKPPLYPMLYVLFIRLFGLSVIGLKMFGAVFVLLAVVAVYWLANQAYGKKVGLLAALLFGVFSSGPMVDGGTVNLETVLHFFYALAIGLFIKASMSGRILWYFLAGLSAALATLVKQVGGVLFFVFLCYGIHEWLKKKDPFLRKQCLHHYIVVCAGALLPVIGLIRFYHFHGYMLNQLYDSMLGSSLRYIQRGYEYTSALKFFYSSLKVMVPENGILWAMTVFATAHLTWRIWQSKERTADRILLWWAFWSFAILWISGTFFYHYFLQMIAPFSVLSAYGIGASWEWTKSLSRISRRLAQGGWMIFLLIIAIIFIKTDYEYFFSYTPIEQTVCQLKISNGVFDYYGIRNVFNQEIASYIRDRTDSTETIYVWGIAPQIYFLAQRRAATRYRNNFNMSILVTNDALRALQTYAPAVMEEVRESRPAYIVQIFRLEDFPELQTFVRDQYILDRSIEIPIPPNRINLYQRRLDRQPVLNCR
jgi:4-amino-4-deoxy-L-arabinose transferase-like glycosyltransferase